MKLQGRSLEPNMRGDDVKALQDSLRQLGFTLTDQDGVFGSSTFRALKEFQQQSDLPATGIADTKTVRAVSAAMAAQPRNGYVVTGQVLHADGSPVAHVALRVLEKRVRDERALARGQTDEQGHFEITYPPPDTTPVSILVRASVPDGTVDSDLIHDPASVENITMILGGESLRGPTEYARIEDALRPTLAAEQLNAADLNDDDVDYLASRFGLDPDHVTLFALSARLHAETDIPAEALYGLLRQGLPTDLTTLVAQSREAQQSALEDSIADNIIQLRLDASIPRVLDALQKQIARLALRSPEPDRPTFAALFDISGVDARQRQRIVADYANRQGTVEEYWQRLRDDPAISNDDLDALQESLKLSAIALNHVDLVRQITALRRTDAIGPHLRDLSRLTADDWRELLNTKVNGRKIGAPVFFGDDEDERIERYAEYLPHMVESLFPTAVLTHRLAEVQDSGFDFGPALTFLDRNPEFEFRDTPVQTYLDAHPGALADVPDTDETVATLKSMQRLFEVAPALNKAQAIAALLPRRIDSATAIRRMGAAQFIRQNQDTLGLDAAQEMYTRSARKADTTLMLLSQSIVFNPTNPAIIAPHLLGQGVPDLEDLFGSLDLCQCEHCKSVYSPAAYLVDILHYLMVRPTVSGGDTVLDVLFSRRPDLGEIELNCHNTNTMLPYVDLVLEILETAVVSGGTLPIADDDAGDLLFPFQTTGETDDLDANPEHLNAQAYEIVRDAVYPWNLPFDLWHAEVRTYLDHLGVSFPDLMGTFGLDDAPAAAAARAAEQLHLTARQRAIVTGSGGDALHALWGFDAPGDLTQVIDAANADQLLDRSDLTYDKLTALLDVAFVNPGGAVAIEFDGADCNLHTATLTNLDEGVLDRLQRFVRLWRSGPWTIAELDAILQALGASAIDDTLLVRLAAIAALQRDLKTPLPVLLNWLAARMETRGADGRPSLYAQVFLDPTVHAPELAIFTLAANPSELADPSTSLLDHLLIAYSALGVRAADLSRLIERELPDTALDLANLTRLYQAVSLAKSLKLSIPAYLSLRGLSRIDPFGPDALDRLAQFVNVARQAARTPFTVAQLDYLLRHQELSTAPVGPAEQDVTTALIALREGLYAIALDHTSPDSSDAILQVTEGKLALLLPADAVSAIMAIVNRTSPLPQGEQIALVNDHMALFTDPADVTDAWFDVASADDATPAERAQVILAPLLDRLRGLTSEQFVVQAVAAALKLELAAAESLLRVLVTVPESDDPALVAFVSGDFAPAPDDSGAPPDFEGTTTRDAFPDAYATYTRLAKAALVLNALKVPVEELDFLFGGETIPGWPDLNALPLEPVESAEQFDALLNVADLFRVAQGLFGDLSPLFELLAALGDGNTDRASLLEAVASLAGWALDDLDFLTGPSGLALAVPDDFRDGQFLVQLTPRFEALRRLPVPAEVAVQWATDPVTAHTAREVKQAARARYESKTQWLEVAGPLRDQLREQQRAALVAYLVHTIRIQVPHFEDPQPLLGTGAHRPAVLELQLKLNMAGAVPPLKVDGFFGPLTRDAVRDFQSAHGLGVDGLVGPNTWAVLNAINRPLTEPDELYAHFLIDVEMDPCMLTSRIVLATSSVQLFVQRCLLNLEPEVQLSPEDTKEWGWMKRYRIWEANRKIFLYPENWLEPDLRDDKTPLFEALESGLLQDEITDATIEREYLKYLNGLNQIAQLEISGIYRQWEVDQDVLHVFGRTHNAPHIYFYRRWIDQREWTPWERVDADIEGNHLMPVLWNRRMYLIWPMFMEKAEETVASTDQDPPPPAQRYYEVRMAWSEYRDGRWSPKQLSEDYYTSIPRPKLSSRSAVAFWPQVDDQNRLYVVNFGTNFIWTEQFRFPACDSQFEVTGEGGQFPFPPVTATLLQKFTGTDYAFNKLKGKSANKQPLKVATKGTATEFSTIEYLMSITEAKLLNEAAGHFWLVLPSTERLYISRSPFAYYDHKRTFLVVPRGTYSGGFADPDLGLTLGINSVIPLDLPDRVTQTIANVVFTGGADRQFVTQPIAQPTAPTAVAPRLTTTLSPVALNTAALMPMQWEAKHFRFEPHYHPYVCLLIEELNRYGIDGILKPDPAKERTAQRKAIVKSLHRQKRHHTYFNGTYAPTDVVDTPRPKEAFDFDYGGAYSIYNWEVFFHAPLMLAKRLSDNQRFEVAHRWFHTIFDPTYRPDDPLDEPWPERVWQIKPFFAQGVGESIQRTMLLLKSSGLTDEQRQDRKMLQDQIEAWRKDPFNPHLIARMRPEAYMKATVMAYLDNLIAWGDYLFQQDTMESINEATQLYILAAEILGERPREIPQDEDAFPTIQGKEVKTFNDLRGRLDAFSNVLVELETWVQPDTTPGSGGSIGSLVASTTLTVPPASGGGDGITGDLDLTAPDDTPPILDVPLAHPIPAVLGPTLFFCIPKNDRLLGYWDTVADRLFKIRHCMNIEGVVRQLPLFQPPIDPGLLVKAAAAGVDISSALNDLNAPPPHYRFQVILQKANELVSDVRSLGGALLSALEKRDAEELALLRSSHELRMLKAVRQVKEKSIDEAYANRTALQKSRALAETRAAYYAGLIGAELIAKEQKHLDKLENAFALQTTSQGLELLAGVLGLIPQFDAGVSGAFGTPVVKIEFGGVHLSTAVQVASRALQLASAIESYQANKASIEAGYDRRKQDWQFQEDLADKELSYIDQQIAAAELRVAIAEKDLETHDVQIENAREVDEYLKTKYTNPELYNWMISHIAGLYFQSYQMAYDLAKRAERAFRYEHGLDESNYIQFGYWDNLKQGLLAGERLQTDLRRLEVAYLDENRREYELTKHISLVMLNPEALLQLKATGQCQFELPEALFDLDYAGHYFRRVRTVSLTIPTVTGPYTTLSCTLRLLRSSVRWQSALLGGQYARDLDSDDPRFRDTFGAIQSISTSSGQNDSGLFELNFRDERYLPFEGAGAISRWQLEMPDQFRQFDYDAISDVILHVRYTAREGGGALRGAALQHLTDAMNAMVTGDNAPGLYQRVSARGEFPTEFHRFLHPSVEADPQTLALDLTTSHFPYLFKNRDIVVENAAIVVQMADAFAGASGSGTTFTLAHPGGEAAVDLGTAASMGNLRVVALDDLSSAPGEWALTVSGVGGDLADEADHLNADAVEDIIVVVHFTVAA